MTQDNHRNLSSKLFECNWIIFNLIVLIVWAPFIIIYKIYNPEAELYLNNGSWCTPGPTESLLVIYLMLFGLFNILRFVYLNKRLMTYLTILAVSYLISLRVQQGNCSILDDDIIGFFIILLPVFIFSFYIAKKEINLFLKILLIITGGIIIFSAGSLILMFTGGGGFNAIG